MSVDGAQWNDMCVRMAARALRGCGCAYSQYQRMYSEAVDRNLKFIPEKYWGAALLAAFRWDYVRKEDRGAFATQPAGHVSRPLH